MRITGRNVYAIVSLLLAFLAPFAHENGVLVGPLLALILFTRPKDFRRRMIHYAGQALLWTLPTLIWLPIWWTAPKATSGQIAVGQPRDRIAEWSLLSPGNGLSFDLVRRLASR